MTDNILKKHVERTAKELVVEVYPANRTYRDLADEKDVKRGKKYYEAAEHVLNALVAGSTTLALDFSDLSKPFGGEGMEGMAMGWDGSRHCKSYGHDFISVSIVGPGFADAVPVYVKIAKGRKSKGDLLNEAIEAVKKTVGENGWFAVDRGMDSVEFVFFMKRRDFLGVVRVNKMDRDVFGTGRDIDEEFAKVPFVKADLDTYRGTVKARIKWKPGVFTGECGNHAKVLVVESRVGGHAIWLYVACPDSAFDDPAEMRRLAILAAQAYRNRWQIERSFETVKQEFSLEKLRVRTFRRSATTARNGA